jgi:hypothetical protein
VTIVNLTLLAGVLAALFGQQSALDGRTVGAIAAGGTLVVLLLVRVLEGRQREKK